MANNKCEYGYKLQKLDIKMMIELGLDVPKKIKDLYKEILDESSLKEFIYFNSPVEVEFISRQYYLRDYVEFAGLNVFELEILINKYNNMIDELLIQIKTIKNKDRLIDLTTKLKILINEKQGVIYLKDKLKHQEVQNKK